MNIRPKIPMLQGGNNIWYNGIQDYDPTRYVHAYDTSRLVNPLNFGEAWASRINGQGRGRYVPNPNLSRDQVYDIEKNNNYYRSFTDALFNPDGTLSDVGKAYARLSDDLLPENSLARVYDGDQIRGNWITTNNDTYGRRGKSFNDVKNYLWYERNDSLPGGRHNVFLDRGKRYFYVDNEGKYHWVSPEDAAKYNISEKPVEEGWGEGDNIYWEDYEITGPKDPNSEQKEKSTGRITAGGMDNEEKPNLLQNLGNKLKNAAPDILDALRLGLNLNNNQRVFDTMMNSIKPALQQGYHTHRQVVGDEATKQAYYRRAAQGQTQAAKPFTSDADRQMAYQYEAKRIGDELRAQGDLADNQEIRRTSDESNQHQWANIERDNRVANSNYLALLDAQAKKANLQAQKYSADTSNWDNYLMGIQNKFEQKKAKNQALQDQIWSLQAQDLIDEDLGYKQALQDYNDYVQKLAKEGKTIDWVNDQTAIELAKSVKKAQRQAMINVYRLKPNYQIDIAKYGTKLTYKQNDRLLYRTARDVVEHFRKMSKMTDDSRIRSKEKPIKLNSYPKSRKYQQGGIAPFTIYRPLGMSGESAMTTQTGTTSSNGKTSSDKGKDQLDMIKELFKAVQGQGLPIDVNVVYQNMSNFLAKSKAFGTELSTEDIASMYLQSMYQINNLKYSKEVYDKAKAYATQNDSLSEFAVNALGHYIVQDPETGKLSTEKTWENVLESGKNPITNQQLLNLRAYSPDLVSQKGDSIIENVINNGMGINKIGAQIKALAGNIGSYDGKIEGLTQVESNRVKSGLQLLANAPDGYYKHTIEDKNQQTQVKAAISYITNMLSPSQRAILNAHGGADKLIPLFLASQENVTHNVSISPLTGKTSDKGLGSGGKGGAESSAGLAFVMGQGPRELIDFNTGTSNAIRVLGIKGVLQTHSKENLGQGATLQDATKSQQGGYLQWNKATFGGSKLNSQAYSHIILNDSTIMGMDLPYIKDINGNEVPDFQMTKKMELADQEISQNNIQNPEDINKIYQKYGLPAKFDSNGNLNTMQYKRFAAIQVTLDENSLQNKDAILSDEIALAGEIERDLYEQAMKKSDKNYDLSDGMWITGWGKDQIYKGTIFVPYSEDIAFAALSSGEPFKQNLPDNTATVQLMQYAPKASQYIIPDKTLSQIKNN